MCVRFRGKLAVFCSYHTNEAYKPPPTAVSATGIDVADIVISLDWFILFSTSKVYQIIELSPIHLYTTT